MDSKTIVFSGECQLAGWSESHTGGAKVTLWLATHEDLEAFRTLTVRKGNVAGHRLMVAMAEIGDDEQPVDQTKAAPEYKQVGGALARLAGLWCHTPSFIDWVKGNHYHAWEEAEIGFDSAEDEEICAEVVRNVCKIESRSALDHDPEAKARFDHHFRHPFNAYLSA